MNPDALSDLVLLAACAASAWRVAVVRAAWRGAMLLLGLAAAMGVLRYSGLEWALGPHRFFSLLAACVTAFAGPISNGTPMNSRSQPDCSGLAMDSFTNLRTWFSVVSADCCSGGAGFAENS